jgi:predicted nucleotidyltransferase
MLREQPEGVDVLHRKYFQTILRALDRAVRSVYEDRLVTIAVFGSVGRGTPRPDSDIDLLIVSVDLPRGRMPRVAEFEAVERMLSPLLNTMRERYGIETSLSPVFKTREEVLQGSLLFLDMLDDALLLYDRGRFFGRYLAALRKKLDLAGGRRVPYRGAWYWVLKEDYTVGEEFDL